MWSSTVFCLVACSLSLALCEHRVSKVVLTAQGPVRGYKDSKDDIFSFYGIPYATAPTGEHKFKAPLPAPSWLTTFEAVNHEITCPQIIVPMVIGENAMVQEQCLVANVYVPDTNETNLPVVVYVHGGAFQIGNGVKTKATKIVQSKKFIMVTFNYRLGPHGFLCLGTEDAPGNAGMKDQVALLRWVNKNIANFGGNPNDVSLWGSSAGSASVDLLMLVNSTKGLFNKIIPDSGANIGVFTVQVDPIANAKEYAKLLNFTDVDDVYALENFYKSASLETLFSIRNFDKTDSSFIFTPCVERKTEEESFLETSPYNILKSGNYEKVPILYGFTSMEGLMRLPNFEKWKDGMSKKFSNYLPADLGFRNHDEKEQVAKEIKEFYFGDKNVTDDTILAYIDYYSDLMFTNSVLRAIKLHMKNGHDKIFLYVYTYVNEADPVNYPVIPYTNNIRGPSHCTQSAALFDGAGFITPSEDDFPEEFLRVKAVLRELWTNFITRGTPVHPGSSLPDWPAVVADSTPYMSIGSTLELGEKLLEERTRFWESIYDNYYRDPQAPPAPDKHHEL